MIVDIFIPCYIDQFHPETGFNMVKVLDKVGCSVNYNIEQTCCGQPAFHSGNWDDCKEIGEKFIKEFLNERYIVTPSAVCAGFVKKQYSEMFHNTVLHNEYKQVQRNMYEFSDFLVNILKISNLGATLNGKAVYMPTCMSQRNYELKNEPLLLLEKVRGLNLLELPEADTCCGFGGAFTLKYENVSSALAQAKIEHILSTGAEYVISSDYSCLMHLNSYIKKQELPLKVMHVADVLASGWV
ncbi:MAG TPA: (Fe-S)-binding protein [Bacteroidia bacterium]|nr:(Fe-S)-binding protein [Bacteroidia bacterium]